MTIQKLTPKQKEEYTDLIICCKTMDIAEGFVYPLIKNSKVVKYIIIFNNKSLISVQISIPQYIYLIKIKHILYSCIPNTDYRNIFFTQAR